MVQVSSTPFTGTAEAVPSRRIQIAPMSFWTLFVVQAALLLMLLLAVVRMLPQAQPFAATPDYGLVREAVLLRATGVTVDPMIEFQPGETGPASSVRGFALNGATYYYQITGQPNFDPLSRNLVRSQDINVVLHDVDGPHSLTIYTLVK